MIEHFGQDFFERLKLNEPYHTQSAQEDVNMPGVGVFHNRDVVLEWVGFSKRNSEDCAVISFQAFLEIVNGHDHESAQRLLRTNLGSVADQADRIRHYQRECQRRTNADRSRQAHACQRVSQW